MKTRFLLAVAATGLVVSSNALAFKVFEDQDKGKWKGRTRTNKLVFFEDSRNWLGRLALVRIDRVSPWSFGGVVVGGEEPDRPTRMMQPLPVLAARSSS